jgi:hypothetical protein
MQVGSKEAQTNETHLTAENKTFDLPVLADAPSSPCLTDINGHSTSSTNHVVADEGVIRVNAHVMQTADTASLTFDLEPSASQESTA